MNISSLSDKNCENFLSSRLGYYYSYSEDDLIGDFERFELNSIYLANISRQNKTILMLDSQNNCASSDFVHQFYEHYQSAILSDSVAGPQILETPEHLRVQEKELGPIEFRRRNTGDAKSVAVVHRLIVDHQTITVLIVFTTAAQAEDLRRAIQKVRTAPDKRSEMRLYSGETSRVNSGAQFWLEHIPMPAFTLNGFGDVLELNQVARTQNPETSVIEVHGGGIYVKGEPLLVPEIYSERVSQVVEDDAGPQSASGLSFTVKQLGHGVMAYVAILPADQGPVGRMTSDPTYLLILASDLRHDVSIKQLIMLFDLTNQQAKIIKELILGRSLKEAAQSIGIKYNTARNHLYSALRNNNYNSQVDFILTYERIRLQLPIHAVK